MTVLDAIQRHCHKPEALKMALWMAEDEQRFDELMQFFFSNNPRYNQRSSYFLMLIFDRKPDLLKPYLERLINNLDRPQPDAVVRNTFRIFQFVEVPESLHGKLIDKAFLYLSDPQQAIAIHVFAMTVIFNACKQYPELKAELIPLIEEKLPYASTGFKNRAHKILRALQEGKSAYS